MKKRPVLQKHLAAWMAAVALLLLSRGAIPVQAASAAPQGSASIVFYADSTSTPDRGGGGGGGGGSDGGTNRRDTDLDRSTGGAGSAAGADVISVLDPSIPLSDLSVLPKTGSNTLIPLVFLSVGAVLLLAGLRRNRDCSGGTHHPAINGRPWFTIR